MGAGAAAAAESPLREPKEVSAGELAGRVSTLARIFSVTALLENSGVLAAAPISSFKSAAGTPVPRATLSDAASSEVGSADRDSSWPKPRAAASLMMFFAAASLASGAPGRGLHTIALL